MNTPKTIVYSRNMRQSKVSNTEKFFAFMTLLSMIWQFITIISGLFSQIFVSFMLLLLWGVSWILFVIQKQQIAQMIKFLVPCVFLLMILCIKLLISKNFSDDYFAPKKAPYQIYTLSYTLMFGGAMQLLSATLKQKMLFIFYVLLSITVVPSYIYVFRFKDAIRDEYPGFGIIAFSYIYALIPFIGLTIIALLRGKVEKKTRAAMICMLMTNIGIIALSNFATAAILTVFSIFLGLIFTRKMNFKKVACFLVFGLIMLLLCKNLLAEIFIGLSKVDIFSPVMKHRLNDIAELLLCKNLGSSFTARLELMAFSWRTFIKYPLLGVPFSLVEYGVLGYHETWITLLGFGGIVGFVAVILSFIFFFRFLLKREKNKYFANAYFTMLITVFILSFLNPIIAKSNLMIALGVMPMLSIYFPMKKRG